jgi:hypothetical protein
MNPLNQEEEEGKSRKEGESGWNGIVWEHFLPFLKGIKYSSKENNRGCPQKCSILSKYSASLSVPSSPLPK